MQDLKLLIKCLLVMPLLMICIAGILITVISDLCAGSFSDSPVREKPLITKRGERI